VFTGIIETMGRVVELTPGAGGARLRVDAGPAAQGARPGASVAVNGVCLTITHAASAELSFDIIKESLRRSTLERLRAGAPVNLERALVAGGRLDGHFVQGHVDGQARLVRRTESGGECRLWFEPEAELLRYVVPKGSVAVDGVSLTVAEVKNAHFSVALIPTTLATTTLGGLRAGEAVNLETDILVRTIAHLLANLSDAGGLTLAKLREYGFA
jgi:riboflavin synthase